MKIKKPALNVQFAAGLFILIGLIWLVFSVVTIIRASGSSASMPIVFFWILSLMMVGNGVLLIAASWGIWRRNKYFYWGGMALLLVNIFLTFTDQFGFFDLATLIIDLGLLILLIIARKEYLHQSGQS